MSNIKERILGAVSRMSDKETTKIWDLILATFNLSRTFVEEVGSLNMENNTLCVILEGKIKQKEKKNMYCVNCGKELSNNLNFCPYCGTEIKIKPTADKPDGEVILMKGLCNRVKNPLFVQNGNAILTNKRFIYMKHSLAKTFAIGVLINLTEGNYDFDIPLKDISSIDDSRQGLNKTIIINTKKGEKYHFYVTHREEWKIKLQNAIAES